MDHTLDDPLQQLARFVAEHAVLLFVGGGALMLVLVIAGWWLVRRYSEPLWQWAGARWRQFTATPLCTRLRARWPGATLLVRQLRPGGYLGLHFVVGFAVLVPALLLFAGIADEIGADDTLSIFDSALAAALQATLTPATLQVFFLFTHLGDVLTLTLIGIGVTLFLLLRRQWLLAFGWSVALAGNGILNKTLKALFQRVRPPHEHGLLLEQGWSFPSGHSSGSMVAYGMLAYLLIRATPKVWHLPLVIAAIALIMLVGTSRIFLQVHFFSDVLAGYAVGAAWLALCIAGTEIALAHRERRRPFS